MTVFLTVSFPLATEKYSRLPSSKPIETYAARHFASYSEKADRPEAW